MSRPPRLARWLLSWTIPEDVRDTVLGDLEEVHHARIRQGGAFSGLWFWGQAISFSIRFTLERVKEFIERTTALEEEVILAVADLRGTIAENRGAVLKATADLKEFARNLKLLAREVRDQPTRLFFDRPRSDRGGQR